MPVRLPQYKIRFFTRYISILITASQSQIKCMFAFSNLELRATKIGNIKKKNKYETTACSMTSPGATRTVQFQSKCCPILTVLPTTAQHLDQVTLLELFQFAADRSCVFCTLCSSLCMDDLSECMLQGGEI